MPGELEREEEEEEWRKSEERRDRKEEIEIGRERGWKKSGRQRKQDGGGGAEWKQRGREKLWKKRERKWFMGGGGGTGERRATNEWTRERWRGKCGGWWMGCQSHSTLNHWLLVLLRWREPTSHVNMMSQRHVDYGESAREEAAEKNCVFIWSAITLIMSLSPRRRGRKGWLIFHLSAVEVKIDPSALCQRHPCRSLTPSHVFAPDKAALEAGMIFIGWDEYNPDALIMLSNI